MRRLPAFFTIVAAALLLVPAGAPAERLAYPETGRGDVVEVHHGKRVPDPYRWLEEDARISEKVRAWVEAQNALTFSYLEGIPERPRIRKRLTDLWNFERFDPPEKVAGRCYFLKNDGLQNHSVLYVVESLDGEPRPILNPNEWAEDGSVALAKHVFSCDGRYLAYAKSVSGSDWREWFIRDLDTGKDLPDRLRWVKFSDVSWTADGKGFFYSRFPAPAEGEEYKALNTNQELLYHRAGTPQSEDVLVYRRPDQPEWGLYGEVSEDGRYLVISVSVGTDDRHRILYKDLAEPYGMPVELIDNFDNEYSFVGNDGPLFYFKADLDAPNGRLVAIDVREPARRREIIPEAAEALRSVDLVGNMFRASYLKDAVTRVRVFRTDGSHVRDVALPGLGRAIGFEGKRTDTETFYSFSSFNRPETIYRYDMITDESVVWRRPGVRFDPDAYVVEQVFYRSKDGTRVPMFIAHRKGLEPDGKRPTLLYGYGGFDIAMTPKFDIGRLAWMEMGGVFALANLRGGGEYGEAWHRAGTKLKKQNVFDDFIAAAEWLIEHRYTRPEKLAIYGASNGGLLVGACMIQRPDLFGAAIPAVGVMDMLRFQKFTAGRYWVDDYGSVEDPKEFEALLAYSPYHTLKPGTEYPATLVTTADTDDRVIPGHSFKFAAALQRADAGDRPQLIRIQTCAGHGGGKPTTAKIEETADMWTFLVANLEMDLPDGYGE